MISHRSVDGVASLPGWCGQVTRRGFLAATAAIRLAGATERPIRLGAKVFLKSADPVLLAREHRRLGYRAAFCPEADPSDRERIRAIEKAFAAEDVLLAEVGAWRNLLDPELVKRKANLEYVTQRLVFAERVGALCCVDCAGSFAAPSDPKRMFGPHPRNLSKEFFDGTVENCRRIIDAVKPKRTRFAIEMMGWTLPDGPDSYLELFKAVDRKEFGVHMDPFNSIVCPRRFYESGKFIRECFAKLGSWIVSCHAKDLEWVPDSSIHFREVAPGRGGIDLKAYLTEISKLPRETPLLIEHLPTTEAFEEGKQHLWKAGAEAGVKFL